MLDFHPITLADKSQADTLLINTSNRGNEYCFGNLYIWKNIYKTQIAFDQGMLVAKYFTPADLCYCSPVGGGDAKAMLEEMMADARSHGFPLRIFSCTEEDTAKFERLFPGKFRFTADESNFDYIYTSADLADLAGKKYHGKRNHISAFEKNYPDWSFEEMNASNIGQCVAMNERWLLLNEYKDETAISAEHNALNLAISAFDELGFYGGLIRAGGQVVAFSFGERLSGNTFCTHFEKAYSDVNGAYPIINREMARRLRSDYEYINREEDTGAEGLRKAKMSYKPTLWLKKYIAECD